MNKRGTGTIFVVIAALLYCTRFLTAAIFGSGVVSWSYDLYHAMLEYVGNSLVKWAWYALIVGIIYLVWAEVESIVNKKKSKK